MRRITGMALVVLMALPAGGAASERPIAQGPSRGLEADAGWLTWETERDRVPPPGVMSEIVAGPVGRPAPVPGVEQSIELGTDRSGRVVGLYRSCPEPARCDLIERDMATGRTRSLMSHAPDVGVEADEHRGVIVLAQRSPGSGRTRITVRRPGRRELAWTERGAVSGVDLGRRLVVQLSGLSYGWDYVHVIDVSGRRPHRRTLVHDRGWDESCDCPNSSARTVSSVSTDGRYAYWVEQRVDNRSGDLSRGGRTRLLRTDVTKRRQVNEVVTLERRARSVKVDRGRVFFADGPSSDVYELTGPRWRVASRGRRVLVRPN